MSKKDKKDLENKAPAREKATIKIIVLGCSNVGKTSLMERFATGRFTGIRRPTVGSDFLSKKITINDMDVNVQIWDTAGQERFHHGSVSSSFFRGAHGALLVYDVNNEKSIDQIAQWRDECLEKQESNDYFPIVVIGNKIDIRENTPENERINQSGILQWCRDSSYGHIETSAKDGLGVEAAMIAVIGLALENLRNRKDKENSQKESLKLSEMYEPKKSGCCS